MSVPFPPPPSEITTSHCLQDPSDFPEPPGRMSPRVLSAGSSSGTLQVWEREVWFSADERKGQVPSQGAVPAPGCLQEHPWEMSGVCSSSPQLSGGAGAPSPSSFCRRRGRIHPHPEWCRAGPGSREPHGCPTLSCVDPPGRVPGATLVPIQQPKARLAVLKYPARRPGLVGTSGERRSPG